jgi:hypothetical protein
MKNLLLISAVSAFLAHSASAAITITWNKSGTVITGSIQGSISSAEFIAAGSPAANANSGNIHSFDTNTSVSNRSGNFDMYFLTTVSLTHEFSEVKLNSYSGNSGTGDNFGYYMANATTMLLSLPSGYVPGTAISGTLTVNGQSAGYTLDQYFVFGDAFKLDDNPFITFVDGSAIPEPTSALLLAASGLALCIRRRRGA